MNKVIDIAKDFSRYPAGRFISDGPFSGERFRNEFLVPALQNNEKIVVNLDGTRGYGSSFLEEAFGGLVRLGFDKDTIKRIISINTRDESLTLEIYEYLDNAL